MVNEIIPNLKAENFFHLPFKPGTRILTENTLNQYSEFREPKRHYLPIQTRNISYQNELLTKGIVLDREPEERVYLKVTSSELLVSCSVDTNESYLSRYAYFTLFRLVYYHSEYDFEKFYWPGFFDQYSGVSKYLMIYKSKDSLNVSSKVRYAGLYKPGNLLPVVSENIPVLRKSFPFIQEKTPKDDRLILGFCFADANNERHKSNHYPFLIPYTATLSKNKTTVKSFKTYVFDEKQLEGIDLTDEQQNLLEICFSMKKLALVVSPKNKEEVQELAENRETNKQNFNHLFELWQQALPLLTGRLYTHYQYTFGMRNVKGKPSKSRMLPCSFHNEIPEICFLWKDMGDYYKLELRLMLGGKKFKIPCFFNTAFFVRLFYDRRDYILLNSVLDSQLISFFQKTHFQLLILKIHYDSQCKHFLDQLRKNYQFIKR